MVTAKQQQEGLFMAPTELNGEARNESESRRDHESCPAMTCHAIHACKLGWLLPASNIPYLLNFCLWLVQDSDSEPI